MSIMRESYKFRKYPKQAGTAIMEKVRNTCRTLYNNLLAERKEAYKSESKSLTYCDQVKTLTEEKVEESKMTRNWFMDSRGGVNHCTSLPRSFIAAAQRVNPKAQSKAELEYNILMERAAGVHFHTLKPFRDKYEYARDYLLSHWDFGTSLFMYHFSRMSEMEITLDAAYLQKGKQARRNYRIAILAIIGHNDDIIPVSYDFYMSHYRCGVLPYEQE